MGFPNEVRESLKSGPQNHHLVAYKHKGIVKSIRINSSTVQNNGNFSYEQVLEHISREIGEVDTDQIEILSFSPLGLC